MNLNVKMSLGKLPWYTQVGAFVALSAAAVAVFYFMYASPAQAAVADRQKQLDGLRGDIAKGMATARRLPEFKLQVADLEARLESLKSVLPEEKDLGDLLRRLHTLAMQSNLMIREFKPATAPTTHEMHAEWPIELQLEGNYHNLGLFFDRISKFSRIITIQKLQVRARDKQEPAMTISAQCVATTFVLIDPATAAAAQAAAKTGGKK